MSFNITMEDFKDIATIFTAVAGALVGAIKYFNYRSKKDKMEAVGKGFTQVVESLGSNDDVKRRAAAILLRRFFDPSTEFGEADTPYAKEAINVIAAILREERTGSFQKLLADGLWYARSLKQADLQKTNLQNAYLGAKGDQCIDLSGADFYRADLSGASLKGARAKEAVFYQSRLLHTVFTRADLTDANFFEADLQGVRFDEAILTGASFQGARNIPPKVAVHLDENGKYLDESAGEDYRPRQLESPVRVFLSRPSVFRPQLQGFLESLQSRLKELGTIEFVEIARKDYPHFGSLTEVRRMMNGCEGAIVVGFGELEIQEATWRAGTPDETSLANNLWPTPWANIEAGMAIGLDLPLLLVPQPKIRTGIFDENSNGHHIYRATFDAIISSTELETNLADWYCSRASTSPQII